MKKSCSVCKYFGFAEGGLLYTCTQYGWSYPVTLQPAIFETCFCGERFLSKNDQVITLTKEQIVHAVNEIRDDKEFSIRKLLKILGFEEEKVV